MGQKTHTFVRRSSHKMDATSHEGRFCTPISRIFVAFDDAHFLSSLCARAPLRREFLVWSWSVGVELVETTEEMATRGRSRGGKEENATGRKRSTSSSVSRRLATPSPSRGGAGGSSRGGGGGGGGENAKSSSAEKLRRFVSSWELKTVELTAEHAARWPMCLAIAIDKTSNVRAYAVTSFGAFLVTVLTYLEASDITGLGALRKVLNPVAVFVTCEFYVLITAFVVLFPATYAQAVIDEKEEVDESDTIRSLKLPAVVAEFAVGSKVAITRLARIITRDFALFMTAYLLGASLVLSVGEDLDSGASSVQEMEGGVSVRTLVQ